MYELEFTSTTGNGTKGVVDCFRVDSAFDIPEALQKAAAKVMIMRDPLEMTIVVRKSKTIA
jgi:hypothetical protein